MKQKDVADLVIEDIKKRKVQGKKKYGVPLRAHNGRVALQDAYEEVLDLAQYVRQKLEEDHFIKEKTERYVLMALNAAGVPEEEAEMHTRVALQCIFEEHEDRNNK